MIDSKTRPEEEKQQQQKSSDTIHIYQPSELIEKKIIQSLPRSLQIKRKLLLERLKRSNVS